MMQSSNKHGGRKGGLTLLALVAAVAGAIVIVVAIHAQQSVPKVPASAAGTIDASPSPTPSATGSHPAKPQKVPLPPSQPTSISIPAIGVTSHVFPIGKAPDGTLAVPAGARLNKAAWFKNSPTPGQPGPSIIEGHVDSTSGPSVFFKLGDVRPGNKIKVTRKDHTVVTFTVNAVRDFPKSKFPTKLVYGGQGNSPTLRLITCSDFDPSIRHHTGNEVVFAHLSAVHHG